MNESKNSWNTTFLLCLFLGSIGAHNFYVGRVKQGIGQLLTFGGCGIWTLIDLFTIVSGKFVDSEGLIIKKPEQVSAGKIFGGLAGFFILIILISALGKSKNTSSQNERKETNVIKEEKEAEVIKEERKEVRKGSLSKENCGNVKNGMSKEQVIAILGETNSQSESELPGYGTTEMWHYQDTGFGALATGKIEACDVHFTNGRVSMKSWTKL